MEAFGMASEAIDAAVADERAALLFEIYPECAEAVGAFTLLGSQWRVIAIPLGGLVWQGLDYGSIPAVFEAYAVPLENRPALFNDLRIMEAAALEILNAPKDSESG